MKKLLLIFAFTFSQLALADCLPSSNSQIDSGQVTAMQQVITAGKLDAAEFDFHLDQMKQKIRCLLEIQRQLGYNSVEQKEGAPKSVFAEITAEIGIYEVSDTWVGLEHRYSLSEVRDDDAELSRFIKIFPETQSCSK